MKTKEQAFIEFIDNDKIPRIPKIWFSKGWDAATQQLEAERENHVKTNIQILSESTGLGIEELELKNEVQCIRPSEALEAMKAVKANYDQDMVEFLEWADDNWMEWNTYTEALTKFKQSK